MNRDNYFFKLFAECVAVRGAQESIICDLNTSNYFAIPNFFYEVLITNKNNPYNIGQLKKHFKNSISKGIDAYFTFLEENKIGFFTSNPEIFKEIDFSFNTPNEVSNSVIEITKSSAFSLLEIINQLEKLNCEAIEIRYKNKVSLSNISKLLQRFKASRIRCFNLCFPHNQNITLEEIEQLRYENKRINGIIVHSCLDHRLTSKFNKGLISFCKNNLSKSNNNNNNVKFIVNMRAFSEARNYNLGLNKRVCIDKFGNIKNDLDHKCNYGNIANQSILETLNDNFKRKWLINNDDIEMCNICQYRYICFSTSDIKIKSKIVSKVEPCNFNPYKNIFYKNNPNNL